MINLKKLSPLPLWHNKKGVALLMVMGAITILLSVIANFTFQTEINKMKVYRQQDLVQARLMAESGIKLSLARLKIYTEILNQMQKSPDTAKMISQKDLNYIWNTPFMYPIPKMGNADILVRNAIADFEKNAILEGELFVTINNVSNLINLNILRMSKKNQKDQNNNPNEADEPNDPNNPNGNPSKKGTHQDTEKILIELMEKKLEEERFKDEDFDLKYGKTTAEMLIKELKFYISDPNSYDDHNLTELESMYADVKAKHAPLTSMSELHLLQGWRDAHIDLIKNDVSVFGSKVLDVNKINASEMKWLFPFLEDDQIKQFFKYRDNPAKPQYFESFKDFASYIVNQARFMAQSEFDNRIGEFKKAGIEFGAAGSFFKVISKGTYQESHYTLTAFISIPVEDPPPKPDLRKLEDGSCPRPAPDQEYEPHPEKPDYCRAKRKLDQNGNPIPDPVTYLAPRVVELTIN